jgi:dimeric dUTPase (all-alpha-NTP-PPase superfamily)
MPDRLAEIFAAQQQLQLRLGRVFSEMSTEEKISCIRIDVLALEDELHEALAETKWKPWAKGERTIERDKYVGELVDAAHFLFNLLLIAGVDPGEFHARYFEKNARNHKRQDDGYTGEKCAACGGELDRPGIAVVEVAGRKYCCYADGVPVEAIRD